MLDEKDLLAIRAIIREELSESENLILKEMDRNQDLAYERIDKLRKNVEELQQYYKINKLENDNTAILLKLIEDFSKRLTDLEHKIA